MSRAVTLERVMLKLSVVRCRLISGISSLVYHPTMLWSKKVSQSRRFYICFKVISLFTVDLSEYAFSFTLLLRILLALLQIALAIISCEPLYHSLWYMYVLWSPLSLAVNPGVKVSCQQAIIAQDNLFSSIVCITSFLFFLRIKAIYFARKWSMVFFFLIWLGVLGACVYMPISMHGKQLQVFFDILGEPKDEVFPMAIIKFGESACEVGDEGIACLSCFISTVVFDTISGPPIFLALSWRILQYSVVV